MFSSRIVLLFLIFSLTLVYEKLEANTKSYSYIIGKSVTMPQRPIIIDLQNEKIFYSNIMIPQNGRYEVFFDIEKKKFIINRIKTSKFIEIYIANINSKKLSEPIFTTSSNGRYIHSRSFWSQYSRTLCLTGKYYTAIKGKRNLTFTGIKILNDHPVSKAVDLSNYLYSHVNTWGSENNFYIDGNQTIDAYKKGLKSDTYVTINLDNYSIKKYNECIYQDMFFMGCLDEKNVVLSDNKYLYTFNSGQLEKKGDFRDSISKLYSQDKSGSGYFGEIYIIKEKDGYEYEHQAIALVPWNIAKEPRILFQGKRPGVIDSVVFSNTPLKLNFTNEILSWEG